MKEEMEEGYEDIPEDAFKGITLEDVVGKSNVKAVQYEVLLVNIDEIMTNLNGYPRELNKEVWENMPYDSKFDYLDLKHEDITKLNTTKSLLKNLLFKLEKDEDRLDFYGEILSYYFNLPEEDAKEDVKNNQSSLPDSENYNYALKLLHYKENNKGVPKKDG